MSLAQQAAHVAQHLQNVASWDDPTVPSPEEEEELIAAMRSVEADMANASQASGGRQLSQGPLQLHSLQVPYSNAYGFHGHQVGASQGNGHHAAAPKMLQQVPLDQAVPGMLQHLPSPTVRPLQQSAPACSQKRSMDISNAPVGMDVTQQRRVAPKLGSSAQPFPHPEDLFSNIIQGNKQHFTTVASHTHIVSQQSMSGSQPRGHLLPATPQQGYNPNAFAPTQMSASCVQLGHSSLGNASHQQHDMRASSMPIATPGNEGQPVSQIDYTVSSKPAPSGYGAIMAGEGKGVASCAWGRNPATPQGNSEGSGTFQGMPMHAKTHLPSQPFPGDRFGQHGVHQYDPGSSFRNSQVAFEALRNTEAYASSQGVTPHGSAAMPQHGIRPTSPTRQSSVSSVPSPVGSLTVAVTDQPSNLQLISAPAGGCADGEEDHPQFVTEYEFAVAVQKEDEKILGKNLPILGAAVFQDNVGWLKLFAELPYNLRRLLNCEKEEFVRSVTIAAACSPAAFFKKRNKFFMDALRNYQYMCRKLQHTHIMQSTPVLTLVVILGCSGVNTALLCLKNALRLYRQHCNMNLNVHIMEVWTYETDDITTQVGNLVIDGLENPFRVSRYGNIHNAPLDIEQFRDYPSNVRYIMFGSTECSSVSWANGKQYAPGKTGLHDFPSDTWFPWHRCIHRLVELKGTDYVVVINELPKCKHAEDNAELNRMSGMPVSVEAKRWGNADRNRMIRTSPICSIKELNPEYMEVRNPLATMADGSTWAPADAARAASVVPVTLRRYYPVLLEQRKRGQRFSQYEQLTLASLRVRYPSGYTSFAPVQFFIENLGFTNTCINGIKNLLPCVGELDRDGNRARPELSPDQRFRCMQEVACVQCKKAFQILGGCWDLSSMSELTYLVVKTALNNWTGTGNAIWYDWKEPPHICDETCPKRSSRPST